MVGALGVLLFGVGGGYAVSKQLRRSPGSRTATSGAGSPVQGADRRLRPGLVQLLFDGSPEQVVAECEAYRQGALGTA